MKVVVLKKTGENIASACWC